MSNKIIIIGAGGHGKVSAETILKTGQWNIVGFCDDNVPEGTVITDDIRVVSTLQNIENIAFDHFIVAMGNNPLRKEIFHKLKSRFIPATIIHPFTSISSHAKIGVGSIVLPGAVISHGTQVGENCIIGSNVHIDHESTIGSHSHIGNGSSIGSNCTVEEESTTPTGFTLQSFSKRTSNSGS